MTARRTLIASVLAGLVGVATSSPPAHADLTDGTEPPGPVTLPTGDLPAEAAAIKKILEVYVRAVVEKDIELFRQVMPTLSSDEERRARAAFKSVGTQVVRMNVVSLDLKDGGHATAKVLRRDTLNGSIVSSFPQTFVLTKGPSGWFIQDIGR